MIFYSRLLEMINLFGCEQSMGGQLLTMPTVMLFSNITPFMHFNSIAKTN
jgi:hypothetical protein